MNKLKQNFGNTFEKNPLLTLGFFSLISFCVALFAALNFRPEYLDGSQFVFDALNGGQPGRFYINHRWLANLTHGIFRLLQFLPADEGSFLLQRIFVNVWLAVLPVLFFSCGIWLLICQKRNHLLPFAYLVFGYVCFFSAAYHESLIPETLGFGLIFLWLFPEDSKDLNLILYAFLLFLSVFFVLGYEPYVVLFACGIVRWAWCFFRKQISLRNPHVLAYFMSCLFGCLLLTVRFWKFNSFDMGQAAAAFQTHLSASWLGWIFCLVGFLVFLLASVKRLKKNIWIVLVSITATLFLYFHSAYQVSSFIIVNGPSRFEKTYFFFLFAALVLLVGKSRMQSQKTVLLQWSLFLCSLFWIHDLKGSFIYNKTRMQPSFIDSQPKGCQAFTSIGIFSTYASILEQNSFTPTKVFMSCPGLGVTAEEMCLPLKSKEGRSTFPCFGKSYTYPNRFNFEKLFGLF